MAKRWPNNKERDWADDLRLYVDPDMRSQTVVTGTPVTLGHVNRWAVPNAVTVTLPSNEVTGSTYLVVIDKIQNLTWPGGVIIHGTAPVSGEVVATLVCEGSGWSVFLSGSGGSGSGLPVYSATHALFSPGVGVGASLSAYNDFFDTSHANLSTITGISLFRYGGSGAGTGAAGSTGALWLDKTSQKFRWSSLEEMIRLSGRGGLLPTDTNGKITYPLAGQHASAGVSPYINTAFLGFIPPTDYRNATISPASVPTAVNAPADLATWANDSTIPVGVSIFVVSINKPVWKTADSKFRDAAAVQIHPVP